MKSLFLIGIFLGVSFPFVPSAYCEMARKDFFSVSTLTPPALIWVEDSQGRRCGVKESAVLNQWGFSEDFFGVMWDEIPNAQADQQNIGDDENDDEPMPQTPWRITIMDGGSQTYTIHLKGIENGLQKIIADYLPIGKTSKGMKIEFFVLVSPGKFRELLATVDTNRNTVRVDRVVTKENLEKDIDIACQLSLISPKGICQELKAKADSVEKALGKKDVKFAIQHLEVFLKDLEVKKSKIKEPALTILREEAQTLLDDLNRGQPQVSTDDASPANSNGGFIRDLFSRLTKIFG